MEILLQPEILGQSEEMTALILDSVERMVRNQIPSGRCHRRWDAMENPDLILVVTDDLDRDSAMPLGHELVRVLCTRAPQADIVTQKEVRHV